jgi:beta-glucosidase
MPMKRFFFLIALVIFAIQGYSQQAKYDFQNPDLSLDKRVDDLVSRLTLEEKVGQIMNIAPGIPRLGILPYDHWSEALHGLALTGIATVFPQSIGLASTWDESLIHRIAEAISTETRAKHHDFQKKKDYGEGKGLTLFSPNINIFRDPRWGRGQETYGEDPYLTSRIGVNMVKGLQGSDPMYLKTIATPKHYAVHSGPEHGRDAFDARTNNYDFMDAYLPAFEACIREGKAYSIMSAYNKLNGVPASANPYLLQNYLREKWGFKGYVVSDCHAIGWMYKAHNYVNTAEEAAAISVKAGLDLECGNTFTALTEAVKQGLITEKEIDVAVKRVFEARFRLGVFDPVERVNYAQIPFSEVDKPEHSKMAIEAAEKSMVLLKNKDNVLPLPKNLKSILVVGPNTDVAEVMYGNYNGFPSNPVTPLQGIRDKVGNNTTVKYKKGCNLTGDDLLVNEVVTDEYLRTEDGQKGLKVEYFSNRNPEGTPILTRIDKRIEVVYNDELPIVHGMRMRNFSARWTGKLIAPETGRFNLTLTTDLGNYRMYLNNKLIIDKWTGDTNKSTIDPSLNADRQQVAAILEEGVVEFKKGEMYDIRIEYSHRRHKGSLTFSWAEQDVVNYKKELLKSARESDVIIAFCGISPRLEGEAGTTVKGEEIEGFFGGDRTSIDLPAPQEKLLKELKATGKPVILVLLNGSAIAVNWANENLDAILDAWYPGQSGGTAIANVLFGDFNPSGRLPVTFYKSVDDLPNFSDYSMKGRTYRYFEGEPLYPFGFGLSYTNFSYSNLKFKKSVKAGKPVLVSVDVQNIGKMDGGEVAQLYIRHKNSEYRVPNLALQGFIYVFLKKGERQTIQFELTPSQLAVINNEYKRMVVPGKIEVFVGGSQPAKKTSELKNGILKIKGMPFELK